MEEYDNIYIAARRHNQALYDSGKLKKDAYFDRMMRIGIAENLERIADAICDGWVPEGED